MSAWANPATAHLTPNSVIALDFGDAAIRATVTIPVSEIGYAYGKPRLTAQEFASHLRVVNPNGVMWQAKVQSINYDTLQGQTDFIAHLKLTPPSGSPTRKFILSYDAVIDKVASHIVLVIAQSDFSTGILHGEPAMLGALQQGATTFAVDRGEGSGLRGFASATRLGIQHIAEGTDHLLFLLALLLPAPLLASGGRWHMPAGARVTVRHLIAIITAFTIGHSLTLVGGAFFGWSLPSKPVELGIAISILVSAIHAYRPIFPGREAWVAGGFGLIHGMAFATVIGAFTLEPLAKAQAILGFNLGIELVQIGLCAIVVPLLLWLARYPAYQVFRRAGAILAGLAALYWIVQRA